MDQNDPEEHRDMHLPISGQDEVDPWGVPDPAPSTLMAALSGVDGPSLDDALAGIESHRKHAIEVLGDAEEKPPFAHWSTALRIDEHPVPYVLWLEPATHDVESSPPFTRGTRWMLGLQTVLDPGDPLSSWCTMTSVLHHVAGDLLALLDVETEQWFDAEEVAENLVGDEPSADEGLLFRVHAASTSEVPESSSSVWLRTEGLLRCGRPELEMLEVPGDRVQVAHELLKALGSLCIARGVPDPGAPFEAGIGIDLSLQDWQQQAELLSPGSIGTREHRKSIGEATGDGDSLLIGRAVVCGAEPRGELRQIHTWPAESVQRLQEGEAAIERTRAWTAARSREAQKRWPLLLEGLREGNIARACVCMDSSTGGREHVWVEISSADETSLEGSLMSAPASLPMRPGDHVRESITKVIDWALLRGGA